MRTRDPSTAVEYLAVLVDEPPFDGTPMALVDSLVTEDGIFEPPLDREAVLGQGGQRIEP